MQSCVTDNYAHFVFVWQTCESGDVDQGQKHATESCEGVNPTDDSSVCDVTSLRTALFRSGLDESPTMECVETKTTPTSAGRQQKTYAQIVGGDSPLGLEPRKLKATVLEASSTPQSVDKRMTRSSMRNSVGTKPCADKAAASTPETRRTTPRKNAGQWSSKGRMPR